MDHLRHEFFAETGASIAALSANAPAKQASAYRQAITKLANATRSTAGLLQETDIQTAAQQLITAIDATPEDADLQHTATVQTALANLQLQLSDTLPKSKSSGDSAADHPITAQKPTNTPASTYARVKHKQPTTRQILLLIEHRFYRELLIRALQTAGYSVNTETSLTAAEVQNYALVIYDISSFDKANTRQPTIAISSEENSSALHCTNRNAILNTVAEYLAPPGTRS